MSFECCAACGHVDRRRRRAMPFRQPAGRCPECGRTTYWTAAPFAQMLLSAHAAPRTPTQGVSKTTSVRAQP